MGLIDYIARTVLRAGIFKGSRSVPAWVLIVGAVLVLFALGIREAKAVQFPTRAEAYAQCMAVEPVPPTWPTRRCVLNAAVPRYECEHLKPNGAVGNNCGQFTWAQECPVGEQWDDVEKTCGAGCGEGEWKNPLNRSECMSQDKCLAKNSQPGFLGAGETARGWSAKCVGGCEFKLTAGTGGCTVIGLPGGGTQKVCTGEFQFSGAQGPVCGAVPDATTEEDAKEKKREECVTTSGAGSYVPGMKLCIKADGMQCFGTFNGKKVCWEARETGEKNANEDKQTRCAGTAECAVKNPPAQPETMKPDVAHSTTTTTTTHNVNNTTTTTTTTTTTRTTTNKTNAAPPGSKASDAAEDGGAGGDGEGDDEGSASGGEDCSQKPIVTGDAKIAMVATQAWYTRCAVEKYGRADSTGDPGDCRSPFTVEGNSPAAQKLRAFRAQVCGEAGVDTGDNSHDDSGIAGTDDGQGNGFVKSGDGSAEPGEGEGDWLDDAGLNFSRSCPAMPTVTVFGKAIQFDNSVMCDWLRLGGQFVLVLAALASMRLLFGSV